MVRLIFGILLILSCGGCYVPPPPAAPVLAPPRYPIITLDHAYPGNRTDVEFWESRRNFLVWYQNRLNTDIASAEEQIIMQNYYNLDLVRRSREAAIDAYNAYARQKNQENGY